MITLYLVEKGILHRPVLYLSDFFEKNKMNYYDSLMRVRMNHDLSSWLKFFLTGVIRTCESSIAAMKSILQLKKECEEKRIYSLGRKVNTAKLLLDHLYHQPIVDAEAVAHQTGFSLVSSYKLIDDFSKLGILNEITGANRNRLFAFGEYFEIFKR